MYIWIVIILFGVKMIFSIEEGINERDEGWGIGIERNYVYSDLLDDSSALYKIWRE